MGAYARRGNEGEELRFLPFWSIHTLTEWGHMPSKSTVIFPPGSTAIALNDLGISMLYKKHSIISASTL